MFGITLTGAEMLALTVGMICALFGFLAIIVHVSLEFRRLRREEKERTRQEGRYNQDREVDLEFHKQHLEEYKNELKIRQEIIEVLKEILDELKNKK